MTKNRRLVGSSRNRRRSISVVAAAALALTLALPAAALAAPYDRTNPMQTGCANSAVTVGSKPILDPLASTLSGATIGRVELRYSTTCHTNWARVISYIGSRWMEAFAYRPADRVSTVGAGGDPGPWYGTAVYSDQLYGRNTVVCAYGTLYGYWGAWTAWVSYCA